MDWKDYQQLVQDFETLQPRFDTALVSGPDLAAARELAAGLHQAYSAPLLLRDVFPTAASVLHLCAADLDGDGCDEIYLANDRCQVQVLNPASAGQQPAFQPANLPRGLQAASLQGFSTYTDQYQDCLVVLQARSGRDTQRFDVRRSENALNLHPRPLRREPLAGLAGSLPDAPPGYNLQIIEQSSSGASPGRTVFLVIARFHHLETGMVEAVYRTPYRPTAAWIGQAGVWLALGRPRLLFLPFALARDGLLQTAPEWDGQVGGAVNTALYCDQRQSGIQTRCLLVACADGGLYALDPANGAPLWRVYLPGIPLSLALGRPDGAVQELLVGFQDGLVRVYRFLPASCQSMLVHLQAWHPALQRATTEAQAARHTSLRQPTGGASSGCAAPPAAADLRLHGYDLSAPTRSLHVCQAGGRPAAWLAAVSLSGKLDVFDLLTHARLAVEWPGTDGPPAGGGHAATVCAAASGPPGADDQALAFAWDDGAIQWWAPTGDPACLECRQTWRSRAGVRCLVLWQPPAGPPCLLAGCEDGWVEVYTPGENAPHCLRLLDVPIRSLAVLPGATPRLVLVDAANPGFWLADLPASFTACKQAPGTALEAELVLIPHRIANLRAWPDSHNHPSIIAVCTDDQVLVYNAAGEQTAQHWPAISGLWWEGAALNNIQTGDHSCPLGVLPRLTLFDMDGDGELELLAACSRRMVAYRIDGPRKVELDLGLERPMLALAAAHLPGGPVALAATDTCLHVFDLQRSLAQQPVALPEDELRSLAERVGRELLAAGPALDPGAIERAYRRVIFALEDLAERFGYGELAGAAWGPVIARLAGATEVVARRGIARLAAHAAVKGDERLWWDTLHTATAGGGAATAGGGAACPAVDCAREATALFFRKCYHDDPLDGWRQLHHALEHGLDPQVLTWLARSDDQALVRSPEHRRLFEALQTFYRLPPVVSGNAPAPDALTRSLQARQRLNAVAQELLTSGRSHLDDHPLCRLYRSMNTLAGVTDEADFKSWLRDQALHDYVTATLTACCGDLHNAPQLVDHLRRLQHEVRSAGEIGHPENLRHLLTWLEKESFELKQLAEQALQKGWYVSYAWLVWLRDLLDGWSDPNGLVGCWIDNLEHNFQCAWMPRRLRWQEGELSAGFVLQNNGFTPAFDVSVATIQLHTGSGRFLDEYTPSISTVPRFDPGSEINGQMVFSLPPNLSGEVTFLLKVAYTQDGRSELALRSGPHPAGTLSGTDYAAEFPAAWKHYAAQFDASLAATGLVFLQLERRARRAFFRACLEKLPPGQTLVLDLRLALTALQRERTISGQLAPVHLHHLLRALLEQIPGAPAYDPLNPDDRARFEQALFSHARPVTFLFLDNLEVLLARLARDEKDTGEAALGGLLRYLRTLVIQRRLHLALGGTYLALRMLRCLYPAEAASLNVVQADQLTDLPGSRRTAALKEAGAFLQHELEQRGLAPVLKHFNHTPNADELVDLCGGSLQLIQFFLLDGLEQLRQELLTEPGLPQVLAVRSISDFFQASDRQRNFFRLLWPWFSLDEKVALALLAHAEFPVEKKDWLLQVKGLRFSRDYHPGRAASGGKRRYSAKVVAERGKALAGELLQKIRASIYFEPDDVWLSGYATRRPQTLESERASAMLLHLLRALDGEAVLARLEKDGLLERRAAGGDLGDIFSLRAPMFAETLRRSALLESMRRRAHTGQGNWFPPELVQNAHTGQPLFARHTSKAGAQEVYSLIEPDKLPAISNTFSSQVSSEEWELFWNFYGLAAFQQQPGQRRKRWDQLVALTRALQEFRDTPAGEARALQVFSALEKALDAAPPVTPFPLPQPGALLDGLPGHLVTCRYLAFKGPALSGLSQRLLFVLVPNGAGWDLPEAKELLQRVGERRQFFLDAEEAWYGHGASGNIASSPVDRSARRLLPIFLVLSHATALAKAISGGAERHVILDLADLAAILAAESPTRQFERLVWNRVGRWTYSPYQSSGPLDIHSRLFVGRKNELRRIVEHAAQRPFIILGSRKIGKTSLLLRVHYELERKSDYRCLPLWLGICHDAADFFDRLRNRLQGLAAYTPGSAEAALRLGEGEAVYQNLPHALDLLRRTSDRMPILLMDELDVLLTQDREQDERLIKLLRDLTQAPQPPFSLIATGHGFVYSARFLMNSAFYNFGETVILGAESPENLGILIDLLENYDVRLSKPADQRLQILDGAYYVPYMVQEICHGLLKRLDDRSKEQPLPNIIENSEIMAELRNCEDKIFAVLFEKPEVSYSGITDATGFGAANPGAAEQTELHQRVCVLLYACVLGCRPETAYINQPYNPPPPGGAPSFAARDAVRYLYEFASQDGRQRLWPWSEIEIDRLLDQMCMTLAIGAHNTESGRRYYFPNDLLPHLLYNRFHREWMEKRRELPRSGERIEDMPLVIELDKAVKRYLQLWSAPGVTS